MRVFLWFLILWGASTMQKLSAQFNLPTYSWRQFGQSIEGTNMGDLSGNSVSLSADGNRLAIGSPGEGDGYHTLTSNPAGYVRIYEYNQGAWVQLGQDIYGEASDYKGYSVSLSADGSRLAIGAPNPVFYVQSNTLLSGYTRIFQLRKTTSIIKSNGTGPITQPSISSKIYPNPIQENDLSIYFEEDLNSQISYQIYDMSGRVLLKGSQEVKGHWMKITLQNDRLSQNAYSISSQASKFSLQISNLSKIRNSRSTHTALL